MDSHEVESDSEVTDETARVVRHSLANVEAGLTSGPIGDRMRALLELLGEEDASHPDPPPAR